MNNLWTKVELLGSINVIKDNRHVMAIFVYWRRLYKIEEVYTNSQHISCTVVLRMSDSWGYITDISCISVTYIIFAGILNLVVYSVLYQRMYNKNTYQKTEKSSVTFAMESKLVQSYFLYPRTIHYTLNYTLKKKTKYSEVWCTADD